MQFTLIDHDKPNIVDPTYSNRAIIQFEGLTGLTKQRNKT